MLARAFPSTELQPDPSDTRSGHQASSAGPGEVFYLGAVRGAFAGGEAARP